jgi:hypothetical protein
MSLNYIFFKKSEKINDVIVFYTNISKISIFIDIEIVLDFIDKILEDNEENYWKWIIDASKFDFKDIKNINKISSIVNMISKKYSENLLQIDIINPIWNFFNIIYFFSKYFIDKEMRQKIHFINYNLDNDENHNLIDF